MTDQALQSVLLPELIGFLPQMLLDDLINLTNSCIGTTLEAVEGFQNDWIANQDPVMQEGLQREAEMGIHALQTLLERHTDVAFDYFEKWSLRNVFEVPPDIPIVVPHHRGLDLVIPEEEEKQLEKEVEELRAKLEAGKRLQELLQRAKKASAIRRQRSEKTLEDISFLASVHQLHDVPPTLQSLHDAVQRFPTEPSRMVTPDNPNLRQWEGTRAGYLAWAVSRLVEVTRDPNETDVGLTQLGDTARGTPSEVLGRVKASGS